MAPTDSPDFDHSAVAWARLFYEESEGTFKGRLEVSPEMSRIMMSGPSTVDSKEENLWSEKWNEVLWGPQLLLDQMDHTAYATAKAEAKGTGKGTNFGVGRRHWSNTLLHLRISHHTPLSWSLSKLRQLHSSGMSFVQRQGLHKNVWGTSRFALLGGSQHPPLRKQSRWMWTRLGTTGPLRLTTMSKLQPQPHLKGWEKVRRMRKAPDGPTSAQRSAAFPTLLLFMFFVLSTILLTCSSAEGNPHTI